MAASDNMKEVDDKKNTTVSIGGTKCFVHHWQHREISSDSKPRALVVIFHGFLAHGEYPTVRYAAEFLSEAGYAVVAIDFPGHGKSEGLRGYIKSVDDLINGGYEMVQYAQSLYDKSLPLVLCGSSMGGAIALSVAHKMNQEEMEKQQEIQCQKEPLVILLAPMLKLNVSSLERTALQCLSFIVPTVPLIPSSATDSAKQYRDTMKRKECEDDELTVSGAKLRVASALTCVDVTWNLRQHFTDIKNPYLLLIADEDVVVKNEGSDEFHSTNVSLDKTKKNYPALHGLLCEPSPLFDEIKQDILDWLNERTGK